MTENNNASILESMISAYVNSKYVDIPPTEAQFDDAADLVRRNNYYLAVSDHEFDVVKNHLRTNTVVIMKDGEMLTDNDSTHKPWVAARSAEIDPFFWNRYKRYLEEVKHWNPRVTSKLGQVSDDILDQCGNPKESSFHIKGLVLGDVQSGKTANYTAIINKAADAGYGLIIILAGIPEVLRQQTQKRLDAEVCGRQSNKYLDPNSPLEARNKPVGVGRYGTKKRIVSFTSEANDFDTNVLKSCNLGLENVNCPVLLVVKKNKTILNNLQKWLKSNNLKLGQEKINLPMLLIDDEADNASVNTKNPDQDPTAINNAIRGILQLFTKATYLAVTATSFANIFINPELSEDLFPSDFIYALSAPDNYIGAERIFGQNDDRKNMLEQINADKFFAIFPEKHKKDLVVKELPDDMYDAAYYFLLTNAIRDYRGDYKEHRSMMIHVSKFIKVQNQVVDILTAWLAQVKSDVLNYGALSSGASEKIRNISKLHSIWNKFGLEKMSGMRWQDMLKDYLYKAIAPITVRAVNGKNSSSALDYDNHKEDGLRIIAVGGNMLSRGLTLEGLCVTYFCRTTNMYDTLMQMGRWFGYRPNYDDMVKIWLTPEQIDNYGQIALATDDLREQISSMREQHLTPSSFGLKVRQDPGSLIVTARNKMKTSKVMNVPISVSGHLLETPRLKADNAVLSENEKIIRSFIDNLSHAGVRVPESDDRTRGNYYWEHVDSDEIATLVENFKTHLWHLSYNSAALSKYISDNDWKDGWDVVLLSNEGKGSAYKPGLKCGDKILEIPYTEQRIVSVSDKAYPASLNIMGNKVRVGAGGCTQIGLSVGRAHKIRDDYKRKNGKNVPDSEYLVKDRAPILMIHIIQVKNHDDAKVRNYPEFLFAIGIGFPKEDAGNKTATYRVNLVELKNWMDPHDGDDDEDE